MSYQALYRVWRPQRLADVSGQKHITQTLQHSLLEQTFSHAYLFTGPRGTGKTSAAKIMAKAVNCERAPVAEPCNQCHACLGITRGSIVDVVEIDAASNNGVDEIRDIRDKVKFAPTEVSKKVYIIDEVHMLSQGAFNALLKTLEEPPEHVMFILATTEPHKIPLTIISRCQRFDFRRISNQALLERMTYICQQENIQIEDEALQLLAQVAQGGMRDALSLLDQAISFSMDKVTLQDVLSVTGSVSQQILLELADHVLHGNIGEAIRLLDVLMDEGKDPIRIVEDLILYYRDVLLYQTAPQLALEKAQITEEFVQKANSYPQDQLFRAIEQLSSAQNEMKWTHHPRTFLEISFIQLSQPSEPARRQSSNQSNQMEQSLPLPNLLDKIEKLEGQIKQLQEEIHRGDRRMERHPSEGIKPKLSPVDRNQKIFSLLKNASKSDLMQLAKQWPGIMEEIKKKKITVHAWLMNGELVACSQDFFLLAFKSPIHRETTEKESHRQLIEEIVRKYLHPSAKMVTIMDDEWNEIKEEYIRNQKGEREQPNSDPFVEEAVNLVGEDLIEVVD